MFVRMIHVTATSIHSPSRSKSDSLLFRHSVECQRENANKHVTTARLSKFQPSSTAHEEFSPPPSSMSLPPVALLVSKRSTTYDDSGGEIIKTSGLPPSSPLYHPSNVPPHCRSRKTFDKVPPLAFFCVTKYLESLSLMSRGAFLDAWPNQIPYRDTQEPDESDLLQLLIPHMHRQSRAAKWQYVDPKLWLTLIRIFWADTLPQTFRKYPLPLADPYLPYIQQIDPTPDFSLIVVLDLRKRKELTDETIISLKALHQLAVLEMASTTVSNAGIAKLAEALRVDEEDGFSRGPWRLRCLGLANTRVDTMVEPSLRAFPLLSVVGKWVRNNIYAPPTHFKPE